LTTLQPRQRPRFRPVARLVTYQLAAGTIASINLAFETAARAAT
jgi:hypothetical protein